jgi:hypothetical protein
MASCALGFDAFGQITNCQRSEFRLIDRGLQLLIKNLSRHICWEADFYALRAWL